MRTLTLPRLSPAVSQFLVHVLVVFLIAFGGQLAAAATGAIHNLPTLLAVVTSAAAAGVTAVVHYLLGLIPTPNPNAATIAVTLKAASALSQVSWSIAVVFLSIFGAQLAVGASHVTSVRTLTALLVAAGSTAVITAVQHGLHLIPVPAPAPVPIPAASTAKKAAARKAAK